jgi:hypothetical protein
LHPAIMDKNLTQTPTDADDRVSRLESRLLQAQEHARVQQNTLDHILQLLQCLPSIGDSRTPQNIPAASEPQPPVTPADPTPQVRARGLKPSTPNDFDRDHLKGRAFLNLCQLYISLCEDQFKNEQAKMHWALSFMKSRRAALYVNSISVAMAKANVF